MDTTAVQTLLTSTATAFGLSVLAVITVTIGIGVAYLLFRFGWKTVQRSLGAGWVRTYMRNEIRLDVESGDFLHRKAMRIGRRLNRRDGLSL